MNKQELIKEIENLNKHNVVHKSFTGIDAGVEIKDVLALVEQLDEPKKVVLTKDVADWLEDILSYGYDLQDLLDDFNEKWFDDEVFAMNFLKNHCDNHLDDAFRKIARAYLDGYEVEKEKLYTVVLPDKNNNSGRVSHLSKYDDGVYLDYGWFKITDHTKLTEQEIKSLDERYMAFAVEVTE